MESPTIQPWGLSRATEIFAEAPPFYATLDLDPVTQLSVFYDEHGEVVAAKDDGTEYRYQTVTTSKPHDGAKDAPYVADDSNSDRDRD